MALAYTLINKSVMILVFSLSYLTKIPQEYLCQNEGSDETYVCVPDDFCEDPRVTSFVPNMELSDSYDNWILRFDMHCATSL